MSTYVFAIMVLSIIGGICNAQASVSSVEENDEQFARRLLHLGGEVMKLKEVPTPPCDMARIGSWILPEAVVVNGSSYCLKATAAPVLRCREPFATNQVMCIQLRERSQSNERYAIGNLYLARSVELAYRMGLGEEARKTCIDMPHYARSFRVEFRGEVMIASGFMRHRARNPQFTDQVTAVYRNLVCTVDAVKDSAEIALALIKTCCLGCDAGPEPGAGKRRTP